MKKRTRKKLALSTETISQLNRSLIVNWRDVAGGFIANTDPGGCSLVFTCSDCQLCGGGPGRPVIVDHAPLLAPIVYDDASWCAELDVT
jgi:hypothetical protein